MAHYTGYTINKGKDVVVDGYLQGYASIFEHEDYKWSDFIGYTNPVDNKVSNPASALIDLSTMKVIARGLFEPTKIITACKNK